MCCQQSFIAAEKIRLWWRICKRIIQELPTIIIYLYLEKIP